jgi:hypothetical protein
MTTLSRLDTVDSWVSSTPLTRSPVAVDQVADPDQVVVEVAEVALGVGGHAGQDVGAAQQGGEHVPLRGHHLAQRDQGAFQVEQPAQLLIGGTSQDLVLELVIWSSRLASTGK